MSTPLFPDDPTRPKWEVILLRTATTAQPGAADANGQGEEKHRLVFRVHHAIGDGMSLVGLINTVLTKPDGSQLTFSPLALRFVVNNSSVSL